MGKLPFLGQEEDRIRTQRGSQEVNQTHGHCREEQVKGNRWPRAEHLRVGTPV